jgi:hypothetical protein
VRNGNAEADPGAENGFPLLDRSEHLLKGSAGMVDQMVGELGDDTGLVAGGQRNDDPVWREELSQKHR